MKGMINKMAVHKYEGKSYFYLNGKWMDSMSKSVSGELESKLNEMFPNPESTKSKKTGLNLKVNKRNFGYHSAKQHKRATEHEYRRTEELTEDQKKALALLESGKNVFLSGEAGTGKSFVLNEYIYRNRNKNVIVCAPTGIAAINIGGATLHRVFNIPITVIKPGEFNARPSDSIIKADVVIIDEISMCRFDVFEYVIRTIRKAEGIQQNQQKQIIVVGDFFQLAPVITSNDREVLEKLWDVEKGTEGFAFQSHLWEELNFESIVLKEVVRQKGNIEYLQNLNKIRHGDKSGIGWFNANAKKTPISNSIYLCSRNANADAINQQESNALEGEAIVYDSEIVGQVKQSDKATADSLALKLGMQVMTLVNNYEEGYQNGSLGKIVELNKGSVKVRLNSGRTVDVKPYNWEIIGYEVLDDKVEKVVLGNFKQIPLKIAYAITIHKAQGQTYSTANISPSCFTEGQLYVALSRVENIEGMSLAHDIEGYSLRTSQAVKLFYNSLQETDIKYDLDNVQSQITYEPLQSEEEEIPVFTTNSKKLSIYDKVQQMSEEELNSCYMYTTIKEKPNAYTPWTDEEEEMMLSELEQGMTIGDVAKKHCRTKGAIKSRIKKIRERT